MPSFLDLLREATLSKATAYHAFLNDHGREPNGVFAFFEGRDDASFYNPFIRRFSTHRSGIFGYPCGGKDQVYAAFESVRKNGKTVLAMYFVDRDLSDFTQNEYPIAKEIFVTDFYSIESYLVTSDMLRVIWDDLLGRSQIPTEFAQISKHFEQELRRFYDLVRPIMAWAIVAFKNGHRPELKNIMLHDLVEFNQECCLTAKDTLSDKDKLRSYLAEKCGVCPVEGDEEIVKTERNLKSVKPKCYTRGKFELWFFIRFVQKLVTAVNRTLPDDVRPLKPHIQLGASNALDILSARLTYPPESLKTFLISMIKNPKSSQEKPESIPGAP